MKQLLHPSSPFRDQPPSAVKIDLYEVAEAGASKAGSSGSEGGWWSVRFVRELLPPIERGNEAVKEALREMHWDSTGQDDRWGRGVCIRRAFKVVGVMAVSENEWKQGGGLRAPRTVPRRSQRTDDSYC